VEEALAEFAATLVSPVATVVVLALAFGLRRPWHVRVGSAAIGVLMAAPGIPTSAHPLAAILGLVPAAVAACLLQAELCLVSCSPRAGSRSRWPPTSSFTSACSATGSLPGRRDAKGEAACRPIGRTSSGLPASPHRGLGPLRGHGLHGCRPVIAGS
jgi:hypothetical protein